MQVRPAPETIRSERLAHIAQLVGLRRFTEAIAEIRDFDQSASGGAGKVSPAEWAEACFYAAQAFHSVGNYTEALSRAEAAYEYYKPTSENEKIARLQFLLGLIYLGLGKLPEAEAELRDAYSTSRRIGDMAGMIDALNRQANIAFLRFDHAQAISELTTAIELARGTDDRARSAWLTGNLGRIHLFLGERSKAIECLRVSLEHNRATGDEPNLSRTQLSLGFAYLLSRNLAVATEFLLSARELIEKHNLSRELGIFHEYYGQLLMEKGDFAAARREYEAGIAIAEKIGPESNLASQLYRLYAECAFEQGDYDLARSYCERGMSVATRLNERIELGVLHRLSARLALVAQSPAEAERHLRESIAIFEQIGVKHELAQTLIVAAESGLFAPQVVADQFLRAEKLFAELNDREGLFAACRREIELFGKQEDYDRALDAIARAETDARRLLELREATAFQTLRRKIEERVAELATSSANEYHFFSPAFAGGSPTEMNQVAEAMLLLMQPVQATCGILALLEKTPRSQSTAAEAARFSVVWQKDIPAALSPHLEAVFDRVQESRKPAWYSDCRTESAFGGLRSAIVIPFTWARERLAVILLGIHDSAAGPVRQFAKTDFFFAAAFAEFVALRLVDEERRHLEDENRRLRRQLEERCTFTSVVTQDPALLGMLDRLELVKDSELPILLEGETGTGKDLVAKAVHYASKWKTGSFVPVSCSALPETMLESELFGHKKGSFTGAATDKVGLIEEADGGTLYLDEVAEIPLSIQVKLLRVLEEKELVRLGETRPRKVNCRIISSTNRDVRQAVTEGRFRKDLYYRLNAVNVVFPPLRQRKEDLPLLIDHYLTKLSRNESLPTGNGIPVRLAAEVLRAFYHYDWPGNVRELVNELSRILVLAKGVPVIGAEYLSDKFTSAAASPLLPGSLETRLSQYERDLIEKALSASDRVKAQAARILGIPVTTLRYKMGKHGLNWK